MEAAAPRPRFGATLGLGRRIGHYKVTAPVDSPLTWAGGGCATEETLSSGVNAR